MSESINRLFVSALTRLRSDTGQGTVEYALVLAVIVGVVAVAVTGLGGAIAGKLNDLAALI